MLPRAPLLWLSLLILFLPQIALALDGNRKGFIIGVGAGYHSLNQDFSYNGAAIGSSSESGLATSVKIGWGATDKFLLYYVRNASWYSAPGMTGSDITYINGISGLGLSYFLSPQASSLYFLLAMGAGDITARFENNVTADVGGAVMLGIGYEMKKHWSFELLSLTTDIDSADDPLLNLQSSALQVTINHLWY